MILVLACACVAVAVNAAAVVRIPLRRPGEAAFHRSASGNASAGIPLIDSFHGSQFNFEIRLGTPGQPLRAIIDTERSDSWFPASDAVGESSNHFWYSPRMSTTHTRMSRGFNQYSVSGRWSQDILAIGGLQVPRFPFGTISRVHFSNYATKPWDGVLGFGFVQGGEPALMKQLFEAEQISDPSFAIYLGRNGNSGELTLGGAVEELSEGKFHYINIFGDSSKWEVRLDAVWVGNERCFTDVSRGSVTPYVSFINGPQHQVEYLATQWQAEKHGGWWRVDCNQKGPPLHFRINGKDFTLTPQDLVVAHSDSECYLAVDERTNAGGSWTLAAPFLRKFYVLFDVRGKRVGISTAKHPIDNFV
eukprot:CAMPEP_0176076870 /NCGR_PEP_ID=MMETSP0120_2-20121206/38432_1 /TAXON_ID=160619 /ORGANISM="Kryptoperidinium foliaceum, Strain CCMP 1326" /LENGTH=360 /DNA_ID=CAMNT_0017410597 /DNA_START=14 /DNA_END=1096 /DNA_ORIENTATION=-